MSNEPTEQTTGKTAGETPVAGRRRIGLPIAVLAVCTVAAIAITWLLTTIFTHKQEYKSPFTEVVTIDETVVDPAVWGRNFPLQYESYKLTAEMPESEKAYRTPTEADPRTFTAKSKIEADPRLVTMWQGYAFSVDYREPRGHEWMTLDQQLTRRMLEFKQPGACANCHVSLPAVVRQLGNGDEAAGWAAMNKMPYKELDAQTELHPVACIDCHEPTTMKLRITRPAFIEGIKEYKASQGIKDYDVTKDATTQEMRAFVCAQCHVEYYFKGDEKTLTFPWDKGLTVNNAIEYYDEVGFTDFTHKLTGAKALKAQHPDFETWNQGVHARAGVTCADCHMAYKRDGASKVTDHQIASPMRSDETVNATCLTCHHTTEAEMKGRVEQIHTRYDEAKDISFNALDMLIRDIEAAQANGTPDAQLDAARAYQRNAQYIMDYSVSENSRGFHAPGYSISILNQVTDLSRRGQLVLRGVDVTNTPGPVSSATPPTTPA